MLTEPLLAVASYTAQTLNYHSIAPSQLNLNKILSFQNLYCYIDIFIV